MTATPAVQVGIPAQDPPEVGVLVTVGVAVGEPGVGVAVGVLVGPKVHWGFGLQVTEKIPSEA